MYHLNRSRGKTGLAVTIDLRVSGSDPSVGKVERATP